MRHLKVYEGVKEPWDVGKQIEAICLPWKEKLNLQEFIINETRSKIYIKCYNEMNDYTFNTFSELFKVLNELKLQWNYVGGREINVDFSKANQDDLDLYVNAIKYNI